MRFDLLAVRRHARLLLALAALILSTQAAGQDYPSKAVRLVVAFAPGGAADIVAGTVAPKLGEALGQNVIVENKPGANGNIAAEFVVASAPDGHTLLWGFPGLATNPSLYQKLSYDPQRDLAPVILVASTPVLLVANPNSPFRTLKELIAQAKEKPGALNFGSAGNGASGHMAGELFKSMANVQMQHVPYRGAVLALNDLVTGQLQVVFDSVAGAAQLVQSGKLRAIAVAGTKRSEMLPDVPTFEEAGLPGYDAGTWFGILAPRGTPQPIVERLRTEALKAMATPEVKARFATLALDAGGGTPEDFGNFLKNETGKWAGVVKSAGIRLE